MAHLSNNERKNSKRKIWTMKPCEAKPPSAIENDLVVNVFLQHMWSKSPLVVRTQQTWNCCGIQAPWPFCTFLERYHDKVFTDAQITAKPTREKLTWNISRSKVTQLCKTMFNSWIMKVQTQFLKVTGMKSKLDCLKEGCYHFYKGAFFWNLASLFDNTRQRNFSAVDPRTEQQKVRDYVLCWCRFNIYLRNLFSKSVRMRACLWGPASVPLENPLMCLTITHLSDS